MPPGELQQMQTDASHGCTVKGKVAVTIYRKKITIGIKEKKQCTKGTEKLWNRLFKNCGKLSLEIFQNLVGQVPG